MKICFVSFEYPPLISGGAGIYASYLTRELARLKNKIHVISPASRRDAENIIEEGVFVHRIPLLNMPFIRAPSYWFSLRKCYEILNRSVVFDVLHTNALSDLSLPKRMVKIPRIVTVHHLARSTLKIVDASAFERLKDLRGELGLAPIIERAL